MKAAASDYENNKCTPTLYKTKLVITVSLLKTPKTKPNLLFLHQIKSNQK